MKKIVWIYILVFSLFGMEHQERSLAQAPISDAFGLFRSTFLQTNLSVTNLVMLSKPFQIFLDAVNNHRNLIAELLPTIIPNEPFTFNADNIESVQEILDQITAELALRPNELLNTAVLYNNAAIIFPLIAQLSQTEDLNEQKALVHKFISRNYLTPLVNQRIALSHNASSAHSKRYCYYVAGKKIVVGHNKHSAILFDEHMHIKREFLGHARNIRDIQLSPNGEYLAASSTTNILIWNINSGTLITSFKQHQTPIAAFSWHPNSIDIISASKDGCIKIWDCVTGNCRYNFTTDFKSIISISFNNTGKYIGVIEKSNPKYRVLNLQGRSEHSESFDTPGNPMSGIFRCNNKPYFLLYIPLSDYPNICGDLLIWDIANNKRVEQYEYLQLFDIANEDTSIFPDSMNIISDEYGSFTFSHTNDGFEVKELMRNGHHWLFYLYSAIKPFVNYAQTIKTPHLTQKVFWLTDTSYILIDGKLIQLVDKKTDAVTYQFTTKSPIIAHTISGNYLAVAEENKEVHIIDMARESTAGNHITIPIETSSCLLRNFTSKDGKINALILRSDYHTVDVYSYSGKLQHTLEHDEYIHNVLFVDYTGIDADILGLVLIVSRNSLAVWSVKKDGVHLLSKHQISCEKIIKSADGFKWGVYWIIDGYNVHAAQISSEDGTKIINNIIKLSSPISAFEENPRGTIAIGDEQGMIHIYVYDTNIRFITKFKAHTLPIVSIRWTLDYHLISSSVDNTAKTWTQDGELIDTITGLSSKINSIRIRDDFNVDIQNKLDYTGIEFESNNTMGTSSRVPSQVVIAKTKPSFQELCPAHLALSNFLLLALYLQRKATVPINIFPFNYGQEEKDYEEHLPSVYTDEYDQHCQKIIEELGNDTLIEILHRLLASDQNTENKDNSDESEED